MHMSESHWSSQWLRNNLFVGELFENRFKGIWSYLKVCSNNSVSLLEICSSNSGFPLKYFQTTLVWFSDGVNSKRYTCSHLQSIRFLFWIEGLSKLYFTYLEIFRCNMIGWNWLINVLWNFHKLHWDDVMDTANCLLKLICHFGEIYGGIPFKSKWTHDDSR